LISRSRMGMEGNRQAYPCRMSVAGEAPVARRTTGSATRSVVAARKGRPRPRERTEKPWEGRVLPHQPDSSCGCAGERGGRRTARPRGERRALGERREEMGRGAEGAGLVAVWAGCPSKEKALLLRRRLPARCWGRELLGPPEGGWGRKWRGQSRVGLAPAYLAVRCSSSSSSPRRLETRIGGVWKAQAGDARMTRSVSRRNATSWADRLGLPFRPTN